MIPMLTALLLVQVPEVRRAMAAGPKDAILMASPQAVCAARVGEMEWTADGEYLIVVRNASVSASELLVWGKRSGKARTLLTFDPSRTEIQSIQTMGGTDRFVLSVIDRVRQPDVVAEFNRITLFSAASGTAVSLVDERFVEGGPIFDAYASDSSPIAVLERIDDRSKRVRTFGPGGTLGPEITIGRTEGIRFDAQGNVVLFHRKDDPKTGRVGFESQSVDFATGRQGSWQPWVRPSTVREPEVDASVSAHRGTEGVRVSSVILAMKGGKADESGVVSTDGTMPLLAPNGDAVAYLDQGVAMVRALTRVDRKAYDDALLRQRIAETVERAKQIAIALEIMSSDLDDTLPTQSADLNGRLEPYLKDNSLLQGFVYTYGGGPMIDVDKPAETVVGYVSGPGGRAEIYVDGHAKWKPDAP